MPLPQERPGEEAREEDAPGPFPSWRALYVTVVAYALVLIVVLYALTVTLDHSAR